MERSRFRTLLGLALIVVGVLSLARALVWSGISPLPALPPSPPLPALPPLPPLPPVPPLAPVLHIGGWFNPPLILLALLVLAILWRRRAGREAPVG
jgi:hypothetical protein